jgi:hypothetical protein
MERLPWPQVPAVSPQPPAPSKPEVASEAKVPVPHTAKRKGFFGKVGSFFAAIFK